MLQHIREKFTGVFALVLLGVLAVSFIFFGIGNFTFLSGDYAATVEGSEISLFQLERAYQNQLLAYSEYGDIPPEVRQSLKATTLERMIRERLVEVHVDQEGYRVSDAQIADILQSEPQFQENGVFERELYYAWLDRTVQDPRAFEAQQRRAIRMSQLQRGIGATAFVTPTEFRRYLNLFAEQRQVSIAIFDIASLANTIVVRDEDVQNYYDDRPDDFRSPESVDFEYLEINRDTLSESTEIAEDVLQQYYEDNSNRFQQDEQRQARHILLTLEEGEAEAEQQAIALTARVQAGEPFEDLARQYSKDGGTAAQGGDLGIVLQSQMPGALGDAIFSMQQGAVRGPVRSEFGFHVVRLDQILPGGALPLDQVRDELLQELTIDAVDGQARALERQLSDALFDATELQSVAIESGLDVQNATGFTRAGGEPFGANQSVIDAVFNARILTDGQISDLIEVDATRSIMLRIVAYHEETRRPIGEVRDDIVFGLQSSRAINIIEDRSRRLREALEDGRDFDEMTQELEAEFSPGVLVSRRSTEIDAVLLDEIFRAKKPSAGHSRLGSTVTSDGDYAVYMLNAIVPGRPETIPLAERDQRKENLQNAAGASDYNAFVNELGRTASIERNEGALAEPDFLQ